MLRSSNFLKNVGAGPPIRVFSSVAISSFARFYHRLFHICRWSRAHLNCSCSVVLMCPAGVLFPDGAPIFLHSASCGICDYTFLHALHMSPCVTVVVRMLNCLFTFQLPCGPTCNRNTIHDLELIVHVSKQCGFLLRLEFVVLVYSVRNY